jgi:hypothetical protein
MNFSLKEMPDDFAGELLRDFVFDQSNGETGCYSTFNLNYRAFVKLDKDNPKIQKFYEYLIGKPFEGESYYGYVYEDMKKSVQAYECLEVIVMWYWDGDGTLLIYSKEDKLMFLNEDCKKDYTWKKIEIE